MGKPSQKKTIRRRKRDKKSAQREMGIRQRRDTVTKFPEFVFDVQDAPSEQFVVAVKRTVTM